MRDLEGDDVVPESPRMRACSGGLNIGRSEMRPTSPSTKRSPAGRHRPLRDVTNATHEPDDVVAESTDEDDDEDGDHRGVGVVMGAAMDARRLGRRRREGDVTVVDDEVVIVHETMLAEDDADATAEDDPLARFAAAPIPTEDDPGPATDWRRPDRHHPSRLRRRPNPKKRREEAAARRRFESDDSNGDDDDSCDDVRDRAALPPPRADVDDPFDTAVNPFDAAVNPFDDARGFEVDDAPVSEHSDGSQERTAGVKGLRMTELLGEGYGKGMRRRRGEGGARATVADLLKRGRKPFAEDPPSSAEEEDAEDEDGREGDGEEGDGREGDVRERDGEDADDGEEDGRDAYAAAAAADDDDEYFSAFSRPPMDQEADIRADDGRVFAEELLAAARPRAEPRDAASHRRRRRRQGRLDAFLSMNDDKEEEEEEEEEDGEDGKGEDAGRISARAQLDAATNSSAPSTRTAVRDADEPTRPAPAPRRFPHTLDSGSMITPSEAEQAGRGSRDTTREDTADGERTLRVACALFKAGRRADGTATPAPTRAESIEWRRAVSFFGGRDARDARDATKSPGAFWLALRRIVADAFEDETRTDEADRRNAVGADDADHRLFESPEAASARRGEFGWELLFRAAATWRAAGLEKYNVDERGTGDAAWSRHAWDLVSDVLARSPLPGDPVEKYGCAGVTGVTGVTGESIRHVGFDGGFDPRAYAAAVADRVATLAREWPYCRGGSSSPVWELWRRLFVGRRVAGAPIYEPCITDPGGGVWPTPRRDDATSKNAAVSTRGGIDRATSTCACCDLATPDNAALEERAAVHTADGSHATVHVLVPSNGACARTLDALATHLAKAPEAKDLKRDLGRVLQSASLLHAVKEHKASVISGGGSISGSRVVGKDLLGSFRAAGGASLRLTPLAADLRHRAATHVLLFAACLDAGAVDQAGVCLRQLCAPLLTSKGEGRGYALPAISADPGARAVVLRAVGILASAWAKRGSALEANFTRGHPHLERLAREGEAALAALAAEAVRAREDAHQSEVGAHQSGVRASIRDSSSSLEDGERVAIHHGAVVAEAAEAAAWMHAALVSCGACQRGAAAAQVRFCEPELFGREGRDVDDGDGARRDGPSSSDDSAGCWRSRLFAQRALAALLAPGPPQGLAATCTTRGAHETLGDALALWALSAGADARAGGSAVLATALFSHPALIELAEGAPPSGPGAARVLRLRRAIGLYAAGERGVGDEPTRRALRGARSAGFDLLDPAGGLDAFFRSTPGGLATREEGEFRVSAGALVSRQMRTYGAGAWGCAMACAARLPRAARVSHDELSSGSRRRAPQGGASVGADLRAARHALASCAAGTVRWLAELIARLPAVPGSIPRGVERIVAEGPVLAAMAPHPCPARSPAWGGWTVTTVTTAAAAAAASDSLGARVAAALHRDGGGGSTCGAIVAAAAERFAVVPDAARVDDPLDGSPASAVVPRDSGRRDFAAATAGLIEGVLDDDDGGAVAHLASALVEPDMPAAAAQFFAAELLPRLLARELRGASQRRCARIWLTAIALLERLAREPEPEPDRGGVGVGRVSPLGVGAVLNDVLPAAATAMLELVASSCGDGLDHQATSAAAALFEYVGARLQEAAARDDAIGRDVAAPAPVPSVAASAVAEIGDDGGESRRKRRRRMMGDGPAGRRRPAPATTAVGYFPFPGAPAASSSYFPFPGAPAVNPAEKQEEDDEEDEEDDEDEDDEDDENDEKNEVGVEERARADAEARRRRLQSTERRRADEVAGAFFFAAPASSGPTRSSDAFKLLASCVSCATAVVCVVALAAPVTDSPTGGGAFRHMSGVTERAREISRHRRVLQSELKRCRAEVEALATELTRRRFGCGLRSAPNPPVGSFGYTADGVPGGGIFWGAEPVPGRSHRVNELWSEPRSRLEMITDAACSLLASASRACSGWRTRGGRGFERATHDLLVAKAQALASAAAMLAEPEAANSAGSRRVPALVDAIGRCGVTFPGGVRERLPPREVRGVGGRGSSFGSRGGGGGGVSSERLGDRTVRQGSGGSGVAFRPFGGRGGGARRY